MGVMDKILFASGWPATTPAKAIETLCSLNTYSQGTASSVPRSEIDRSSSSRSKSSELEQPLAKGLNHETAARPQLATETRLPGPSPTTRRPRIHKNAKSIPQPRFHSHDPDAPSRSPA